MGKSSPTSGRGGDAMSRIGRLPITVPSGRRGLHRRPGRHGQGPQGHARATPSRSPIEITPRGRRPHGDPARRRAPAAAPCTACRARWWPTWSIGVTEGYSKTLEIVGVGYRVAAQGLGPRVRARLQPPGRRPGAGGHQLRGRVPDPFSASRASTSSRSARSPRTSASSASPTRTRARACATPARSSGARSERLVSSHGCRQRQAERHQGEPRTCSRASAATSASARRCPARRPVRASS